MTTVDAQNCLPLDVCYQHLGVDTVASILQLHDTNFHAEPPWDSWYAGSTAKA